jgi:hypothetical protein
MSFPTPGPEEGGAEEGREERKRQMETRASSRDCWWSGQEGWVVSLISTGAGELVGRKSAGSQRMDSPSLQLPWAGRTGGLGSFWT